MTYYDYQSLYKKYDAEINELAVQLRTKLHQIEEHSGIAFSDVEGELAYMIIRETKPDTVFEISPWNGWSTNYLLGAVSRNGTGEVHAFEIKDLETVIRANQLEAWDQHRLHVHVGDARDTVGVVPDQINFLLLDSCHEAWFADWYATKIFPRVNGTILIQDIAFVDELERSSEAQWIWEWLQRRGISVDLVGRIERELQREAYAERRNQRSNAVLFRLPESMRGPLPCLDVSLEQRVSSTDSSELDRGVRQVLGETTRANRHRLLVKASEGYRRTGNSKEADRCLDRAYALACLADLQGRRKALQELLITFLHKRFWKRASMAAIRLVLDPGGVRAAGAAITSSVRSYLDKLWRRVH